MNTRAVMLGALITAASLLVTGCGKPDVEVDVLAFEMPVAPDAEPPELPGHVWAGLEVEMCSNVSGDDGAAVGLENWVLEMPDETRISPTERVVAGSPRPALEFGGLYMLSQDECAAGWIMFAVPEGSTPEAAIFSGPGDPKRISLP